jgi:polysaccharide export outer membrane protein
MFLLLNGAAKITCQDSAQVAAQDKARIEAAIKAQDPSNVSSHGSEPTLKIDPVTALRNFEPDADEEYRLGKGDEITVSFSGRPEMLAKLVVGPDGRITLPLAGDVMLAERTRSEAAKAIETALANYYTNLSVQVTITKYTANRVLLLGAVDRPGEIAFDGTPTLLEVLARGGVEAGPNKSGSSQEVDQVPERCAIYRGTDQVLWVDLRAMMESGNAMADMRLRRDDVVYVPSASERFISILGEVQHPGAVPLAFNSTLASVLAQAGGITDHAGSNPHIQVVDPAGGTSRVLTLKDVLNPAKSLEVTLKPGEIVYVPKSGFYKGTYVLERLSPLITMASVAAYAGVL